MKLHSRHILSSAIFDFLSCIGVAGPASSVIRIRIMIKNYIAPLVGVAALFLSLPLSAAPHVISDPATYIDGKTPEARFAGIAAYCASQDIKGGEARKVMVPCTARILAGKDIAQCLKRWEEVAKAVYQASKKRLDADPKDNNARNPFEKHALIHSYVICREKVDVLPAIIAEMKRYVELYKHREWFGYGALNYKLMNDGAGFIAAEIWPDLKDSDGLDSAGIQAATKARLFAVFDEVVRYNTDEYGAPGYLGIDFSAMKLLADFAKDPEMRKRAAMTLDSMILHAACAWNRGYYITPGSRLKGWSNNVTGPDGLDTTGAIAWFYFGADRPVDPYRMNLGGCFWFTVKKSYEPPALFTAIARDRSKPFTHLGSARERIRYTIYQQKGYGVGSQCEFTTNQNDGIYKEARRVMFKWVSDKRQSAFIPLQVNPQRPYNLKDNKPNSFGYGENPFTQVLQKEGTLVGITSVPEKYPHWKMYAPFSKDGAILKRIEKNDWVFCHGGPVLFAFRYLQPSYWAEPNTKENLDVLQSDSRENGWILDTAPIAAFAGGGVDAELERFSQEILTKSKVEAAAIESDNPRFTYHSVNGHTLDITHRPHKVKYVDQHKIDGKPVNYSEYPHFGNPWVQQPLGADKLHVRHGGKSLTYDFVMWNKVETTGKQN